MTSFDITCTTSIYVHTHTSNWIQHGIPSSAWSWDDNLVSSYSYPIHPHLLSIHSFTSWNIPVDCLTLRFVGGGPSLAPQPITGSCPGMSDLGLQYEEWSKRKISSQSSRSCVLSCGAPRLASGSFHLELPSSFWTCACVQKNSSTGPSHHCS